MQKFINFFLALLKWPLAILMVLAIFPALKTDIIILYNGLTLSILGTFFLPLLIMIGIWFIIPKLKGSFISILEHEVTHMIFALLTFHVPQDITVHRGQGGYFSYFGRGNWLISLAPYFFPTSAALVMALGGFYALTGEAFPMGYWIILGLMTGYHIMSTMDEIHSEQIDFKDAGYTFTILFLPGINLITYGLLMAYVCHGFKGFPLYMREFCDQITLFLNIFI
ncbi:MAG: hypothetical protein IKS41_05795 [Alphaproteobacteria bacterium]|nr:hypothetical protein [Alphaproteobacteria bacterium]